jgi:pimeloyl-ACP methyl ester carboxylesterase
MVCQHEDAGEGSLKHAAAAAFAALLSLTACGDPTPAPETSQTAKYADEWLAFADSVENDYYRAVNLHETAQGLAGRLVKVDGSAVPLRNIQRTATTLSFSIPALGASYAAEHLGNGEWAGEWVDPGPHGNVPYLLLGPSTSPPAMAGELVMLSDGRRMHIACAGEGAPAVVLDYGAGGTMKKDWGEIASAISAKAHTQVCLYDRAGRGLSDPSRAPRDAAAVVRDLDEMLTAAKIAPPYVLVGHSLASYHVRLYANTHAGKTAGLVLVDPSGDGQLERFYVFLPKLKDFQETALRAQAQLDCIGKLTANPVPPNDPFAQQCGGNDPDAIRATKSEIEEMPVASTQQLTTTRRSYGDMPLIVLTRTDYEKDMPPGFTAEDKQAMRSVWEGMHAEMVALSSKGKHRFVPGAGHYIQRDAPQAVIDAVAEVVAAARNNAAP